jgi:hypothetical protein
VRVQGNNDTSVESAYMDVERVRFNNTGDKLIVSERREI